MHAGLRGIIPRGFTMTDPGRITVVLKGPRGLAELSDFANLIANLRQCLKNVCRCIVGTDDVDFDVSDLGISSATLTVTPVPNGVAAPLLSDVSRVVNGTVKALESGGELDDRLDYPAIRAFYQFSSIVRKHGTRLAIGDTWLSGSYVARIAALTEPDTQAMGSVSGRLEKFSIHKGNKFTLYPPISGEEVECEFDRGELENVLKAVDHTVTVYGILHYAKSKAFPSRVEVTSFEVLPDSDMLPTLLTACGSMHSSIPSEQLIREMRDEW
jgi:hypothetical protein